MNNIKILSCLISGFFYFILAMALHGYRLIYALAASTMLRESSQL